MRRQRRRQEQSARLNAAATTPSWSNVRIDEDATTRAHRVRWKTVSRVIDDGGRSNRNGDMNSRPRAALLEQGSTTRPEVKPADEEADETGNGDEIRQNDTEYEDEH